ncbi:MAG: condensation domain-containing protein, partial [Cyanobacteria bacterium P01_F01_bin.42]
IELEGHGREDGFDDDIDISRTVGWFTTLFPIVLNADSALIKAQDWGTIIKQNKEYLRGIPRNGLGYGLLRSDQLQQSTGAKGSTQINSEIRFNYLGQTDQILDSVSDWSTAPESPGRARGPQNQRTVLLEINCWVKSEQLQVNWLYSQETHHKQSVQRVADQFLVRLKQLIEHCLTSGGFTPSDFPQMELSQSELDELLEEL